MCCQDNKVAVAIYFLPKGYRRQQGRPAYNVENISTFLLVMTGVKGKTKVRGGVL
jgi:hypothetical protein